jgi:hypothetical protein
MAIEQPTLFPPSKNRHLVSPTEQGDPEPLYASRPLPPRRKYSALPSLFWCGPKVAVLRGEVRHSCLSNFQLNEDLSKSSGKPSLDSAAAAEDITCERRSRLNCRPCYYSRVHVLESPHIGHELHNFIPGFDGLAIEFESPLGGDELNKFSDRLDIGGFEHSLPEQSQPVLPG